MLCESSGTNKYAFAILLHPQVFVCGSACVVVVMTKSELVALDVKPILL